MIVVTPSVGHAFNPSIVDPCRLVLEFPPKTSSVTSLGAATQGVTLMLDDCRVAIRILSRPFLITENSFCTGSRAANKATEPLTCYHAYRHRLYTYAVTDQPLSYLQAATQLLGTPKQCLARA